jgi:hypothetical protein
MPILHFVFWSLVNIVKQDKKSKTAYQLSGVIKLGQAISTKHLSTYSSGLQVSRL